MLLSLVTQAKQYALEKEAGSVIFKAKALGLNFEGKGAGAEGTIIVGGKVKGELAVDMDSFDTGIGLRNSHMKDKYLETGKYPKSKLIIKNIKGFDETRNNGEYEFEGTLIVREIEKPISNGKVILNKIANGYNVTATFDTKISDYSMPIPKYAGIALKDEIHVIATTKAIISQNKEMKSASK